MSFRTRARSPWSVSNPQKRALRALLYVSTHWITIFFLRTPHSALRTLAHKPSLRASVKTCAPTFGIQKRARLCVCGAFWRDFRQRNRVRERACGWNWKTFTPHNGGTLRRVAAAAIRYGNMGSVLRVIFRLAQPLDTHRHRSVNVFRISSKSVLGGSGLSDAETCGTQQHMLHAEAKLFEKSLKERGAPCSFHFGERECSL